jgi:hypothetical protein
MLGHGLLFVRSGCHVNTSRIDPKALVVDGEKKGNGPKIGVMKLADTKQMAIGVMVGVLTECALVEPAMIGSNISPIPIWKVMIAPFPQEMRRDTSVWGQVFGFKNIPGAISDLGFSFSTCTGKATSAGSPVKSTALLSSVKSTARGGSSPSRTFDELGTSLLLTYLPDSQFFARCSAYL